MKLEEIDIRGVVLKTERLVLRAFEELDLNDFYEYAKVDGVGECAGWKHHESIEESKRILNMFIAEHRTFAVVLNGKVIGSVGIEKSCKEYEKDFSGKNLNEIGYVLSKNYWENGYATEAVAAVVSYCFKNLNCDMLTCGHFMNNDRSRRVIEKCGFKYYADGTYESALGITFDSKYYVLTRAQYNENLLSEAGNRL